MPNTQPVQPIQQPVIEDLKNAQTMAELCGQQLYGISQIKEDFASIARLIRHAIEGLSEPNLAAMQAGEVLLREWSGTPEPQRQLRDTIAGILHAQLTGEIPPTWSHE